MPETERLVRVNRQLRGNALVQYEQHRTATDALYNARRWLLCGYTVWLQTVDIADGKTTVNDLPTGGPDNAIAQ